MIILKGQTEIILKRCLQVDAIAYIWWIYSEKTNGFRSFEPKETKIYRAAMIRGSLVFSSSPSHHPSFFTLLQNNPNEYMIILTHDSWLFMYISLFRFKFKQIDDLIFDWAVLFTVDVLLFFQLLLLILFILRLFLHVLFTAMMVL